MHLHGGHSASADDGQVTGANFLFEPGQARTYTYQGVEDGENEWAVCSGITITA